MDNTQQRFNCIAFIWTENTRHFGPSTKIDADGEWIRTMEEGLERRDGKALGGVWGVDKG
jgi:hypothetical protein